MKERSRLLKLCVAGMEAKGLKDERHKERLKKEIKAIDEQAEHEYLLNLHDKFKSQKLIFPKNDNNLLVSYLLGLTNEFNIEEGPLYVQGEFPDIDIDYLKDVRDYIKRDWAPRQWGQQYICEIGTYGTSGIKSSILDMARVHNSDKDEIQSITVTMEDKDDEGKLLEWDKALEMYPLFKSYCDRHPQVSEAARLLLDRNRTGGVHAGGLIISSVPIDGFVPLEVRSVNKTNPNGVICSAWTEGLNAQDLQPVGLIKFDLLVINNLMQIAQACHLIKDRYGLSSICALPGSWDWSDISYLNDPQSIAMANSSDLKCIFQFDGEGIRKLVKRGGVGSFDDLAAYSALYRPGPINCGMDARYCKRKRWEQDKNHEDAEPYNIHPLMKPILGKTYGVLVYQEQVMDILRVVGNIPDMHTEKVRKAISKKKVKDFIKYKEMFIENGQKNLEVNRDFVEDLWNQIESFAEYGFNKSVLMYTKIPYVGGEKEIQDFVPGDLVYCVNQEGKTVETEVVALHDHGEIEGFEVTFDDGYQVTCSANHKFLTENGQISISEICRTRSYILSTQQYRSIYAEGERRGMEVSVQSGVPEQTRASQSSDCLRYLQGERTTTKIGEIKNDISLWPEDVDQGYACGTSASMRPMSSIGMEEVHRNTCGSLRTGIPDLERSGGTSQDLREVRGDQAREHQTEDGQTQRRQSLAGSQEDLLGYSEENFTTPRVVGSKGRKLKEMARREPGEVRQVCRSCLEESKAVKNGDLAQDTTGMGIRENSLRQHSETSGLCEGQDLDRSGRILPLLRAQKQFGESVQAFKGSVQRSDVERGVCQEGRCDASEIEHGMFSFIDGNDEDRDLGLGAGHAPISNTGNLVRRKVVRVVPVGKCHMFDLEVANPTHNFILPNGVVTSNSHAYAYTYISARLLWLKSHYPLEFYTAILMCEDDHEKFKQIRIDAKAHGVAICPVQINRSKENFYISDEKIYFGFSNIKGIGPEVAKKIVEGQPYKSFSDFLNRFGTDASVIKALVSLGVFEEEYDRITLRKFSEFQKDKISKRRQRQQRYEVSLQNKHEDLKSLLTQFVEEDAKFSRKVDEDYQSIEVPDGCDPPDLVQQWEPPEIEPMCHFTPEADALWKKNFESHLVEVPFKYRGEERIKQVSGYKILQDLAKKYETTVANFASKEEDDDDNPTVIDKFDAKSIDLEEEEEYILKNERWIGEERSFPAAEKLYYGFEWVHELETCPLYKGLTLDKFLEETKSENPVEVRIEQVRRRTSKSGTEFYSVDIEDANSKRMVVNVWADDMNRWKSEFKAGNLLRMRVRPPSGGFNTLTFLSCPRHEKAKMWPDKESDPRIFMLTPPEPKKPVEAVFDDFGLTDAPGWEEI